MKAVFGTELSQEQELREVEMAFSNAFPSQSAPVSPMPDFYPWIVATFDDLLIVEVSSKYYKVAYTQAGDELTFAPFVDWEEVDKQEEWVTKSMNRMIKLSRIKAVGDWELDVLGIPFGSPSDKDGHGQYFDADTDLHLDRYPNPAVHYYHGLTAADDERAPVEIGEVKSSEVREDGVWYRIILDKAQEYAAIVMEAAKKGLARASSGTAIHLARIAWGGHIENWPVIEISLFDTEGEYGFEPASNYAVAIPVMKALFERAGIECPDNLSDDYRSKVNAIGDKQRATAASRKRRILQLKAREHLLGDE